MKRNIFKKLALIMTLMLVAPIVVQYSTPVVAEAAKPHKDKKKDVKPSLNVKKVSLKAIGETYQLTVKNQPTGSTLTWYSTKSDVATVNNAGLVTAVKNGTAVIKCRIVTANNKKSLLSCPVTVKTNAVNESDYKVKITNETTTDDMQIIEMGTTYDFNAEIRPAVATGASITWAIADTNVATVDAATGIVTPKAAGTTVLTASGSSISLPAGTVVKPAQITIKVVTNLVTVQSVVFNSNTVLVIKFSDAIDSSTIIETATSVLKNTILVTPVTNKKGSSADPGVLKGVLSDGGKTLTITATNYFQGAYNVQLTSMIKATDGTALESYNERVE